MFEQAATTVSADEKGSQGWSALVAYLLFAVVGIGLYFVIRAWGEGLASPEAVPAVVAPATSTPAAPKPPQIHVIHHVLATLAAVLVLGFVLGRLFHWVGQPPVIGEVVAGILLGPSLLGAIWPAGMHALMPDKAVDPHGSVAAGLGAIAQLGVVLYMFLVGLELNASKLQKQAHSAVMISHVGIIVPFLLGALLSLWLFSSHAPAGVSFTSFSLFLGVAMSITAFPVLARILTDRGMQSTELGIIALSCAAADDVTAWCLLALVVGIVQAQVGEVVYTALGVVAYLAVMFGVVRPVIAAWCEKFEDERQPLPPLAIVAGFLGILCSALATEAIGIHAVFGGFLFGALIPADSRLAREFLAKLREPVVVLLVPAYFAFTGMRTELGLISGWSDWLACGAIILVATLGKFGGVSLAARLCGMSWRDAAAVGILMNTRGLMLLIVLNVGLDLGVLDAKLFALLVVTALVTTMATSPVLQMLLPEDFADEEKRGDETTRG